MVDIVTRYRWISRHASAGSHCGKMTSGSARTRKPVAWMCRPAMWFIGMPTSRLSGSVGRM